MEHLVRMGNLPANISDVENKALLDKNLTKLNGLMFQSILRGESFTQFVQGL